MKNANQTIDLTGRWEAIRFYIQRGDEQGIFPILPADGCTWEFSSDGKLTESTRCRGVFRSGYSFSPEDNTLRIVRGDSAPENPLWTRPEDVYHVVAAACDLVLYDFEEKEGETEEKYFVFRQVVLRRPL